MQDCKNNKPCGCEDEALTTPPSCGQGTPNCPDPEPCAETFSMGCIIWNGGELSCDGSVIANNGERMDIVLQRFLTLACSTAAQGPIGYGFTVSTGVPSGAPTDNRIYYLDLNTGDMYEWDGAAWNIIGTLGGGGAINNTFSILGPNNDGDISTVALLGNAGSTTSGDEAFLIDRLNCNDPVTITINSPDGITTSVGDIVTIPSDESLFLAAWEWSASLPIGVYNFTLTWESCGITRIQNATLTLT